MDPTLIPSFNTTRQLEALSIRKPSKDTLKAIRVEIRTAQPEDHVYSPGDSIQGVFTIFSTNEKVINDVYFNDIEILLENRFLTSQGMDLVYFTMHDNPSWQSFPKMCHDPDQYPFESCTFPFEFTLPREHLEDTCDVPGHCQLLPSYGLPSLCGLSFSSTSVAGLKPLDKSKLKLLQHVSNNKFCNTYYINVKVKQNIKGLDRPYIVFTRSMELKVQSKQHIGDSQQLPITKSTSVKQQGETMGNASIQVSIPPSVDLSRGMSLPVEIFYEPLNRQEFPKMSLSIELSHYNVQSKVCTEPITTPINGLDGVITQKLQTLHGADLRVDTQWTPSYYHNGSYSQLMDIQIPALTGIIPTFHSCHLQNIYCLHIELKFNEQKPLKKKHIFFFKKANNELKYQGVPGENVLTCDVPIATV
jgi:hypothetical protein